MATQPIDYGALAKQYGATSSAPASGKVDYAALAKQYGSTSSLPPQQPEQKGFFSSFVDQTPLPLVKQFITHPQDTITGLPGMLKDELVRSGSQLKEAWNTPNNQPIKAIDRTLYAIPFVGNSLKTADEQAAAGNYAGAAGTVAGLGTTMLAPEMAKGAVRGVKAAPEAYRGARSAVIGGSKLDEVIPGDTVTPRQRYEAAKAQGVNLDTAQATNAPVARAGKWATEHSLAGSSKFEGNRAANVEALHGYSEKLLNEASPVAMSREEFGNRMKAKLVEDQQKLNDQSAALYRKLDADIGTTTPDATAVRDTAQQIVDANKDYYDAHPEFLTGGAGKAWKIVNSLAEQGEPGASRTVTSPILDASGGKITREVAGKAARQDTWSDLHKLRSDLLDISRGPEMIGDRPTGWIKQLTGAVDETMTTAAEKDQVGTFREANEIYKYLKQTYDDPKSRMYHIVRAPDGLTAANTLAEISPDVARRIGEAAPELIPQLQRQTMSRLLNPAGNELPELNTLSNRVKKAQKEKLAGVLTPEQLKKLEDLGRTSKLITYDSNPSGTAKVGQKYSEASGIGMGLTTAGAGIATANPALVLTGVAPAAWAGATRVAAGKLVSPEFTESIMNSRAIKPKPGESLAAYLSRRKAAGK